MNFKQFLNKEVIVESLDTEAYTGWVYDLAEKLDKVFSDFEKYAKKEGIQSDDPSYKKSMNNILKSVSDSLSKAEKA